jgi:hypothetical protein
MKIAKTINKTSCILTVTLLPVSFVSGPKSSDAVWVSALAIILLGWHLWISSLKLDKNKTIILVLICAVILINQAGAAISYLFT